MNRKLSKIMAAVMAVVLLCPSNLAVAAEVNEGADMVAPCYEIATSAKSLLSFSGTTATCTSRVSGTLAVEITIEQTLQKEGLLWIWSDVDGAEWTKTVYSSTAVATNTKSGLASGTYRLKTEFTLTASDGTTETITVYSTEQEV